MSEYVGLDVSKDETSFCVKNAKGEVLAKGKALSDPQSLFECLREHCLCPEMIVMETGSMSGWLTRGLRAKGLTVECVDARRAHAVLKLQRNKTDANDAELLAELARTGFFEAVTIKSLPAQHVRSLLKARDQARSGRSGEGWLDKAQPASSIIEGFSLFSLCERLTENITKASNCVPQHTSPAFPPLS